MKFRKINLEENIEYDAKIVSWSIDDDKRFFRVFAEIAGFLHILLMERSVLLRGI